MSNLKNTARKFYCLRGFVAIIFTLLFLRSAYVFFFFPGIWNGLITVLMGIFAYWWVSGILKIRGVSRGTSPFCGKNSYHRDLDL